MEREQESESQYINGTATVEAHREKLYIIHFRAGMKGAAMTPGVGPSARTGQVDLHTATSRVAVGQNTRRGADHDRVVGWHSHSHTGVCERLVWLDTQVGRLNVTCQQCIKGVS